MKLIKNSFTLFCQIFGNVVNRAFLVSILWSKNVVGATFFAFCNYAGDAFDYDDDDDDIMMIIISIIIAQYSVIVINLKFLYQGAEASKCVAELDVDKVQYQIIIPPFCHITMTSVCVDERKI